MPLNGQTIILPTKNAISNSKKCAPDTKKRLFTALLVLAVSLTMSDYYRKHPKTAKMPYTIKTAAIVVKPNHNEARTTADELASWLTDRGITLVEPPRLANSTADDHKITSADLVVVLGGDGTMIAAARMISRKDTVVLGINYGSLGYLTDFRIEEMFPALEAIIAGKYEVDPRVMLECELRSEDGHSQFGSVLNDIVVNKTALARIIEINVALNGQFVNKYRADGLIVSTPTGSTAYNLSAGGPIIYPSMNAVVLTPICPFTLTNRPIVVPDHAEVILELENVTEGVVLSLDGQRSFDVKPGDRICIRKSGAALNIIQPENRNYFDVLRDKLKWGR